MTSKPWYEAAFGPLYPVLYRHRDAAEARMAVSTFGDRFASDSPVLDLACGAGRYLSALAEAGVAAMGLDLSPTLLGVAAEDHSGRLARADMRRIPVQSETVGTVINMFTSFGYFESDDHNLEVLSEVKRVLRPGGVFLLDFFNALPVFANPPADTRREELGFVLEEERSLSPDRRFLVKRVRAYALAGTENVEYEERVRAFLPDELMELITRAGLTVLECFGDYGGSPFDPADSNRLILLCGNQNGQGAEP